MNERRRLYFYRHQEPKYYVGFVTLAAIPPLQRLPLGGRFLFCGILVRLYPNQAAYASVSVRRSNSALGIITTSPLAPDIQEMLTGQSCCRTSASVSENVGSAF